MRITVKRLIRDEKGQVMILALILLVVGGLIIAPLMGFMSTGLIAGEVYERRMDELYAGDAGVEDALYNILSPNSTLHDTLQNLEENESYPYTLGGADPITINDISPVTITITKLSLLAGLVDESEYKTDRPHEGWVTFDMPVESEQTETYVAYNCTISFNYTGVGNRQVQKVGAFFFPSSAAELEGPYDVTYTLAMTDDNLVGVTAERVAGGFHFVWEWEKNQGPVFDQCQRTGSIDFKFKVHDPDWEYQLYFIWALVKEQDISFVTNAPGSGKWLIEATAGNTEIRSAVVQLTEGIGILTWEIN